MIDYNKITNIEFEGIDFRDAPDFCDAYIVSAEYEGEEMTEEQIQHFNYATLTYVIHEVSEHERIKLLHEIAQISDYIIMGDYLVPKVKGFGSLVNGLIEFIAGKEHYQNYKSYISAGGLKFLADRAGFKIVYEMKRHAFNNHILILATDKGSGTNSLHFPSAQLIN